MAAPDVLIVGGGLAGLACARRLHESGASSLVLEAAEEVGGRVRTDELEGFLLDRGFQVLLTAYPEARRLLDYEGLDLRPFYPGTLVRWAGGFHRAADPWRRPLDAVTLAFSPLGTLGDKVRIARMRARLRRASLGEIFGRSERTTMETLREEGFSSRMIERLLRPFLGGVFLERELATTSRMLEFVLKMFAEGDATLPARGMGAIPKQLAGALPDDSIRTGARVERAQGDRVRLEGGEELEAGAVVVAVDGPEAARLVGGTAPPMHATVCLYFDAPEPPITDPILVLDGEGDGPVNNLCVPSSVSPAYAPPGRALVSASIVGGPEPDDALESAVRDQLRRWFGAAVGQWRLLRAYAIHDAVPAQPPGARTGVRAVADGLYVCGDHTENASINGALLSGRRAAEAFLAA